MLYYLLLGRITDGRYSSISLSANSLPADITDRYFGSLESSDFSVEI